MDDDVELRILRERVYGTGGERATPAMIERLVELEDRVRRSADVASAPAGEEGKPLVLDPARTAAEYALATRLATAPGSRTLPSDSDPAFPSGVPVQSGPTAPPQPTIDPTYATAPTARPVLRAVLLAVGALAFLGVGAAIGSTATATAPAPTATAAAADTVTVDPAAATYPELTFAQTIEDAISADVLRDSAIDSGSTRYIATVNDFEIYLAQPDDGVGRCIVTFIATDDRPWSAGCATGAQEGAAVFGIDDRLSVAIGVPDASQVDGIPIRLSESVTAYVAR
ncbi:hypothetical protein [Microbacterium sp. 22296]|uniref:hypothetical protein n=1 Tax=Microbacterium sp. 22296 TaxID=3453903 RepID=UPI003F83900A